MTVINHKSISGITSITAPAGSDDLLTVHTNDTAERFRILKSGAIVTGVATASNFKTGTTNVHSVGVEAAGINVLGADTPIGTGATIYDAGGAVFTGVVTATSFSGAVTGTASGNPTLTNGVDNRVITATGANAIQGESTLTYDGTTLQSLQSSGAANLTLKTTSNSFNSLILDSNRAADTQFAIIDGRWNGNVVNRIQFVSGSDGTNKDDGYMAFHTRYSGNNLQQRVKITADGKLGINGNFTPSARVEIRDTIGGGGGTGVILNDIGSSGALEGLHIEWRSGSDKQSDQCRIGQKAQGTGNGSDFFIATNHQDTGSSTERFRINSKGGHNFYNDNSYAVANLNECNSDNVAINIRKTRQGQTKGIAIGAIGNNSQTGLQAYDSSDNSANNFTLNRYGGFIGVGVQPTVNLHVKSTPTADTIVKIESESGYDARLQIDTSNGGGAGAHIDFQMDGTTKGGIEYVNNGSSANVNCMLFRTTNNSEKFRIDSVGSIGQGTGTPRTPDGTNADNPLNGDGTDGNPVFTIYGDSPAINLVSSTTASGDYSLINFGRAGSSTNSYRAVIGYKQSDDLLRINAQNSVVFDTGGAIGTGERLRVNSDGRLFLGSSLNSNADTYKMSIKESSSENAAIMFLDTDNMKGGLCGISKGNNELISGTTNVDFVVGSLYADTHIIASPSNLANTVIAMTVQHNRIQLWENVLISNNVVLTGNTNSNIINERVQILPSENDGYDDSHILSAAQTAGNWEQGAGASNYDSSWGWLWQYANASNGTKQVRAGIAYDHKGTEEFKYWSSYGAHTWYVDSGASGDETAETCDVKAMQIGKNGGVINTAQARYGIYTLSNVWTTNQGQKDVQYLEDCYGQWIVVAKIQQSSHMQANMSSVTQIDTSTGQATGTQWSAAWGDSYPSEVRFVSSSNWNQWRDNRGVDFIYGVPNGRQWKKFFTDNGSSGMTHGGNHWGNNNRWGFTIAGGYDGFGRYHNPNYAFLRVSDGNLTTVTNTFFTTAGQTMDMDTANDAKFSFHATAVSSGQDCDNHQSYGYDDSTYAHKNTYPATFSNHNGTNLTAMPLWVCLKLDHNKEN